MAGKSNYIAMGDNHLLTLGQFGNAQIVKPADFLRMRGKSGQKR
jgi:predicted nucleic acid-binding protein